MTVFLCGGLAIKAQMPANADMPPNTMNARL